MTDRAYVTDREWEYKELRRIEVEVDLDGRTWMSVNGAPPFEVQRGHKIVADMKRRGLFG